MSNTTDDFREELLNNLRLMENCNLHRMENYKSPTAHATPPPPKKKGEGEEDHLKDGYKVGTDTPKAVKNRRYQWQTK
jgi:hypothetical protein